MLCGFSELGIRVNGLKGRPVNTMRGRGSDSSKSLTIIVCSECHKGKPCRKEYKEWSMCENSLHYHFKKQREKDKVRDKRSIQDVIDKVLPVPKKITKKTREETVKWANRFRFV